MVKDIVAAGANVNAVDNTEYSALIGAAYENNLEMVKILLAAGVDKSVNATYIFGGTALMLAAKSNNPEMVKVLLAAGADVNAKKSDGKSALDYANSDEIKSLLLAVKNSKK